MRIPAASWRWTIATRMARKKVCADKWGGREGKREDDMRGKRESKQGQTNYMDRKTYYTLPTKSRSDGDKAARQPRADRHVPQASHRAAPSDLTVLSILFLASRFLSSVLARVSCMHLSGVRIPPGQLCSSVGTPIRPRTRKASICGVRCSYGLWTTRRARRTFLTRPLPRCNADSSEE